MIQNKFCNLSLVALILILSLSPGILISKNKIEIELDIKNTFVLGETILFHYSILSDSALQITISPYINCPAAPARFLQEKTIKLEPGKAYIDIYKGILIDQSIEPQICTAGIAILEPFYQKAEKQFKIETEPSFDVHIQFCKDQACTKKSKVFVKGDRVYFDYSSDVSDLSVEARLIVPDLSVKTLTLPVDAVLDRAGKYTLKVKAKKEGYKTNYQTLELVVLEEEPKVIDERVCNANGICEPEKGEMVENCPQDCLSPTAEAALEKIEKEEAAAAAKLAAAKRKLYYLLGGIVILLAIGVGIYFYWRKKWLS